MYTMTQGYKKKSRNPNIIIIITSLALTLFLIASSVKLVLGAKFIYYRDVDTLKINETVKLDKSVIKENYNILISYVQNKNVQNLNLPNFKMSDQGRIHFEEVKSLFNYIDYLFYVTLIISVIGIILSLKNKNSKFLKINSILLILLPIIMSIPFIINFDRTFTAFHKIAFNNDYWLFDPSTDPIITILPQEFFMHAAIGILVLVALFSILSYGLYRLLNKKERDSLF